MAKYIHVAQIEVPAEHEAEFNSLYDSEHVPRITGVPGVISGRRYKLDDAGWGGVPRYLAIYELESGDLPHTKAWEEAAETPTWHAMRKKMTVRQGGTFKVMD